MKKINLGIVGLGWPGQRHAEGILGSKTGVLYACADAHEERRANFVQRFQPQRAFASFEEMLADPALNAVVICLPNFLHFPLAKAALQAGKHVLCEKPPTMNAGEMRLLREEAEQRQLVYCFGRQARFSPELLAAKTLVEQGRLGEIYFGRAVFIRSRGIPVGVGGWFTEKARSGGGALIDLGVHALDSAWYLMGTPRPVTVSAQVFQNFAHQVAPPVNDVEDGAYGMVRFANGAVIQLEISWASHLAHEIPESKEFGRELINTTLHGAKGTIQLTPPLLFTEENGVAVKTEIVPQGADERFTLQMQNFLDAIAGTAPPVNTAEQAFYLMEMLDAIYQSSASGREVLLA